MKSPGILLLFFSFQFLIVKSISRQEEEKKSSSSELFNSNEDHEEKSSVFVPKEEWQTIKPGQKIPGGLHYRINLQTGVKEAKLLSENLKQGPNQQAALYHDIGQETKEKDEQELLQEKEAALYLLKKLSKAMKTESEVMINLLNDYKSSLDDKNKSEILKQIEFLVHKFDVGKDFVIESGHKILIPDLNSSSPEVRANVAFTLGSAMQGNPKVQAAIFNENGLLHFLHLIYTDSDHLVQLRSLYALSCLLRQNIVAQESFINQGGISLLLTVFRRDSLYSQKIRVKIITLFSDLVNERKLHIEHASENENLNEDITLAYKNLPLEKHLVDNGFCDDILVLLQTCQDSDTVEKVIEVMTAMHPACSETFSKRKSEFSILKTCSDISHPYSQMVETLVKLYSSHEEL